MPGASTRFIEALRLARTGSELTGELGWDALPRLVEAVVAPDGEGISYRLALRSYEDSGAGRIRISGTCEGAAAMRCQRCMAPVSVAVHAEVDAVVLATDADWHGIEGDAEPIELDADGRLDLHALVEDELLLALPLVPKHRDGECDAALDEGFDAAEVQRPFAGLAEMMRGSGDDPQD